ncbi:hypothetical protein BU16DRAFT_564412 [Lophium mytilinum]|uniref:Uncharacterized protein n=1 Tax=Lophium mytilinum TaxID=390894 RepID=A0A6A6QI93_9PEZI|nr:hypothetical protein BU16DRAFT_564412 [Lophium mytilinum]
MERPTFSSPRSVSPHAMIGGPELEVSSCEVAVEDKTPVTAIRRDVARSDEQIAEGKVHELGERLKAENAEIGRLKQNIADIDAEMNELERAADRETRISETIFGCISDLGVRHLVQTGQLSRNRDSGRIQRFDIFSKSEAPKLVSSFSNGDWSLHHTEGSRADEIQPNHLVRVFLVEDLSPSLMQELSSTFNLSPEAFEEHLYGAQYSAKRPVHPAKWSTASMDKQHMSMTWYRPVTWQLASSYDEIEYHDSGDDETLPKLHPSFPTWREREGEGLVTRKYTYSHRFTPNIIRRAWKFARDPAFSKTPHANTRSILAWEEKITLIKHIDMTESAPQRNVFMLLDPLPKVELTKAPERQYGIEHFEAVDNTQIPLFRPLQPRQCLRNTISMDMNHTDLKKINSSIDLPSCALEDIISWLRPSNAPMSQDPDPVLALLQVVFNDSTSLLGSLRMSLDDIRLNRNNANDHAIQQSVDHWRSFIAPMDIILPKLEENLETFMQFAYPESVPLPVRSLADHTVANIKKTLEEASRLQNDLRADISIIENRRGIASAESVTKVTELAFVFVPLSFSASIFSWLFLWIIIRWIIPHPFQRMARALNILESPGGSQGGVSETEDIHEV